MLALCYYSSVYCSHEPEQVLVLVIILVISCLTLFAISYWLSLMLLGLYCICVNSMISEKEVF